MSVITRPKPLDIIDGLDGFLTLLEESSQFIQQVLDTFGNKPGKALLQLVKTGFISSKNYRLLKDIDINNIDQIFDGANIVSIIGVQGIDIPEGILQQIVGDFKTTFHARISQYRICSDILEQDFDQNYEILDYGDSFVIYQNNDGAKFLKIGNDFLLEVNFSDIYFGKPDSYLFFESDTAIYIFNMKTGELCTLEGEYEDTFYIDNRVFIQISYPNSKDIRHSEVHCVEEDISHENDVVGSSGFIFGLLKYDGEVYSLESSYTSYTGYQKGTQVLKKAPSLILRNVNNGEILLELIGSFYERTILKNGICFTTQRETTLSLESGGVERHLQEQTYFIPATGSHNLEDFCYTYNTSQVYDKINTPYDYIIILKDSDGTFTIASFIQRSGIGAGNTINSIQSIISIDQDDSGAIINFIYDDGTQGTFQSMDYYVGKYHQQEISNIEH